MPAEELRHRWNLGKERLLPKTLLASLMLGFALAGSATGAVRITEFMASNLRGVSDEDGNHEDWIEIFNDGPAVVSLNNWSLTDDASNLTKWRFPNTNIGPSQFMLLFASEKDRRTPGARLHTNFKLGADGEYLALVQPDGVTIATEFSPAFPTQTADISYGFPGEIRQAALVKGAVVSWRVWTNASQYEVESPGWNASLAYSTAGWNIGSSGLGWDDSTAKIDYTSYFGSNACPRSQMLDPPLSLFTRFLPNLTHVAGASSLRVRIKYADGFAAWLNGVLVASNLTPANPSWDSLAPDARPDTLNGAWAALDLPLSAAVEGTNLLAIQLFVANTNATDLLLLPELDLEFPGAPPDPAYLFTSTPGQSNSAAMTRVPPTVELVSSATRPPGGIGSPALAIKALVTPTLSSVTNVMLYYRLMFANEIPVVMTMGKDGICAATISTEGLNPGEMLRWRIEAMDASGAVGTGPLFLDANDDDRYYGTVALNPDEATSHLPILHWFVEDFANAQTVTGTRGSFFYLDRFYDNILVDLHGQSTTAGIFPKPSHNLDFNQGNRFVWREDEKAAKDVNLLSNWADKSKVRNTLAYEMFNRAGVLSHWAFPVRLQTNGAFCSIYDLVEEGDDRYLERVGLDPDGALYKITQAAGFNGGIVGTNVWPAEKKTRRHEDNSDLAAFNSGVATNWPMSQRRRFAYDNVDLAATINYLAALVISSCGDQGHKNFYLYRDSNGTREWRLLPWDVDLTFGHDWIYGPCYFCDVIITYQPLQLGVVNSLKDIIFNNPELNEMFLRRLRTLMDDVLQPPDTPAESLFWEKRIAELLDRMDPPDVAVSDADLSFAKWGWWTTAPGYICQFTPDPDQELRPQAQRLVNSFFPGRRAFLAAGPLSSGAPIPPSQCADAIITVEIGDYSPASGRQDQEYLVLRNPNHFAVDLSGWKLKGGIDYEFPPGTVLPSGGGAVENAGLLFVAKNPSAFRQRTVGPGANQCCLVSGPYAGRLSASGETIELADNTGRLVGCASYPGNPSMAQQFLRVAELMYNPAPLAGSAYDSQEFEFLELLNTSPNVALDLSGISFSRGIGFTFSNSVLLGPRQTLLLARNPVAFAQQYGGGFKVVGPYDGSLDNGGERLTLVDAAHDEILDFSYSDNWYPATDGMGFSLVVVDEFAAPGRWDSKLNWRSSSAQQGSPGAPTDLVWRGNSAATRWDAGISANWDQCGRRAQYTDESSVMFDDTGFSGEPVNLVGKLAPFAVIVNTAHHYTFDGSGWLSGAMNLTKIGEGSLTLNTSHTFSGGTIVRTGTLLAGSIGANQGAWGTGPITLMGGTLQFKGYGGAIGIDWGGCTNMFIVPAGHTGTLQLPPRWGCNSPFTSPLMGGGTLNVTVDYLRIAFGGDWSAFTGRINVSPLRGTGDFRINNTNGYANAAFYLGDGVSLYNINAANQATDIGELGGACGACIGAGSSGSSNPTWRIGAKNTTSTYAGVIANAGTTSLVKVGSGTLILTGTNTYGGTTMISDGTLRIGDGGTTGTPGTGNIVNNATLAVSRADSFTDDGFGIISGAGHLAQRGAGLLALSKRHTYRGATLIEAGTLALRSSGVAAFSSNISISAGALFDVSERTGGSLRLGNCQTLGGSGSVKGDLSLGSGASLAPGNSLLGTLAFSNALTLSAGSTTTLEISSPPVAQATVRVHGHLTLGGTLVVTNAGRNAFGLDDRFRLFDATTISGSFDLLVLPALEANLAWNTNNLAVDGTLTLIRIGSPAFSSVVPSGKGNFHLAFSGPSGLRYELRASTNAALTPVTLWDLLKTGTFGTDPGIFDDGQATNHPQRFYLIRGP